jgi:hypothetical protein
MTRRVQADLSLFCEQVVPSGIGCRFSAVDGVRLSENAAHMVRHRVRADEKRVGNVAIALADGYEA